MFRRLHFEANREDLLYSNIDRANPANFNCWLYAYTYRSFGRANVSTK